MIKNIKERYTAPNNFYFTVIGDALVHLGTLITTYNIFNESMGWSIASLFLVWAGHTLPKFTKAANVEK